ncbi:MAG: DUF4145 domain-containing protein [Rubrivivax sp.]
MMMIERNVLGIETRFGYRTFKLIEGDITALDPPVDILITSAIANAYAPTTGTVFASMEARLGINVRPLSEDPALDLRDALGVWVSKALPDQPFARLVCCELLRSKLPVEEVLQNVFVALLMLEAKSIPVRTVAMPVLGAGSQQLSSDAVIRQLLQLGRDFAERSKTLNTLMFVEIDSRRAAELASAMDQQLGRSRVALPRDQVVAAVRSDISNKLMHATQFFRPDAGQLHDEWRRLLDAPEVRSVEVGVLSRRLVELFVRRYGAPASESLPNRIRALERTGVAPWICDYLQVLRHFGNEAAHEGQPGVRQPPIIEQPDLALCLFCVERVLGFAVSYPPPSDQA